MSNIFPKGTVPFYPVPQNLVDSGKLKKMSEAAHKLYQFLLFKAQKHTRVALELSNREIRESTGLSPNTIRRGRTELWEAGLVALKRSPGGCYVYVILNPLTGVPMPPAGQTNPGSIEPAPMPASSSPPWDSLGS